MWDTTYCLHLFFSALVQELNHNGYYITTEEREVSLHVQIDSELASSLISSVDCFGGSISGLV
jgi:hypothetical protein